MINFHIIARLLSIMAFVQTTLLITAMIVGICWQETHLENFVIAAIISFVVAMALHMYGRKPSTKMTRREGYLSVVLTWLLFSVLGSIPFALSVENIRVSEAFFEAMSGFTTTGATIMTNLDEQPHSLLMWRSMSHWFGGLGIIFFTIALLPSIRGGAIKLFAAEATGLKLGKLHPRVNTTARWICTIYIFLTLVCTGAYYLSGMDIFDATNHAMSTIATGGFSTHDSSIAYFQSPLIEYVACFFMFVSGMNFTLIYIVLAKHKFNQAFSNSELKAYAAIMVCTTLIIAAYSIATSGNIEAGFRNSLFQVVSLQTTTGFVTYDFTLWPAAIVVLIYLTAIIGPMAGSTGGGMKCVRIVSSFKLLSNELNHLLHPRAVLPIRIGENTLSGTVIRTVFAFFVVYVLLLIISIIAYLCMGLPLLDAYGVSASLLGNIGPALGHEVNSAGLMNMLPDAGLWLGSFLMLAGRLEIFAVLLPLFPAFWKKD